MNTRQPWIRAMVLTVLGAAVCHGSALAGWMWDTNGDRIDDRMAAVEQNGLTAAHVGGSLAGKLRFAVLTPGAPFTYGVYIAYDHAPTDADAAALTALGVPVQVRYRYIHYIRSAITFAQAQQVAQLPGVARIETIPILYATNDIATESLRARDSGGKLFPSAWTDLGVTGRGVTVAILDTGVNDEADGTTSYPGHESLKGKFVGGGSFFAGQPALNTPIEQSENPKHQADPELTWHGTHVAGTAIGTGGPSGIRNGNPPGFYAGVAPDARLVDLKVLSDAGLGFGAADALEWVIYHRHDTWGLSGADTIYSGVDVASMSLGGTDNSDGSDASCAAVNAAVRAGVVVCVATGNDGNTHWIASPSAADLAISVGAFTDGNTVNRGDDFVADYSNEGPRLSDGDGDHLDEMKPSVLGDGTGIMSALGDPSSDGTKYHHINGTSMATPTISGVCALILSANPTLSPAQVRQILQDTAEHRTDRGKQPPSAADSFHVDANYHPSWGWGTPDAYAAILEAVNPYQTQVVRMALTGQASPQGVKVEWWTQREYSLLSFAIDRAPEVLGGPGTWTEVHAEAASNPQVAIHGVANRHHYEWTDLDPSLDPHARYWYRVRWINEAGLSHPQPAMAVRVLPAPVVARVKYSWTHDFSDGDLDVRFGTGTDPEHPIWFRQGEGAPAADSIVDEGGVSYTGTLHHYFHVDLTTDDLVAGYLPPSESNPWFLRVKEGGFVNTLGRVNDFSVTWYGPGGPQTFTAPNPVTPTVEKQSTVFWIPLDPATSANHAPVFAAIPPKTIGEGLPLTFTVNATDADGNALSYSAASLPPGATFNGGTRTFSWTPGYSSAGAYAVRFIASDGALPIPAADTETVAITVTDRNPGDNTAPLLDAQADRSGVAEQPIAFRFTGRDAEGGPIAWSIVQDPGGGTLDASTGSFAWTPNAAQTGLHYLTVRGTDPGGLSTQQTVHLTVTHPELAPSPPTACTGQHAEVSGVVGMGTDPGTKSETYHAFAVPSGTQGITASLTWFGGPAVDLDFYLLDADSNVVQSSASTDDPEVLSYDLPAAGTYLWKVVAFTNPDTANYTIAYDLCVSPTTAVAGDRAGGVSLANPWPNPFHVSSAIRFDLPKATDATLQVFDVSGRLVRTLAQGRFEAGRHLRIWDGRTTSGGRARSGVYFYRFETRGEEGRRVLEKKAVLVE